MKIYISGRINGLPLAEAREKFARAEEYLLNIGYKVVNPMRNGLPENESWQNHMLADIALLFTCDAVYMLSDWLDSKGAMIEKHIAQITGLKIYFESKMGADQKEAEKIEIVIFRVESALQEVTGLTRDKYAVPSRSRAVYFARMVFAKQCYQHGIHNKNFIGRMLGKDHATVLRCLRNYPDELKFNPEFREVAEEVNRILMTQRATCL